MADRKWKVTVRDKYNRIEVEFLTDAIGWANQIAMWASKSGAGRSCTITTDRDHDYGTVRDSCNIGRTVYIKTATGCWLTDMDAEFPVYIKDGHLMSPMALEQVRWPLGEVEA